MLLVLERDVKLLLFDDEMFIDEEEGKRLADDECGDG